MDWSEQNDVNFRAPQDHQVAKFLAYLHLEKELAYSTILVHKSAIFTFCGPSASEALSENLLMRQVLKAIAAARPRDTQPPVWDVQILFDWLATYRSKNTFEISRRTATILLLALGRRVHNLTLLRVSEDRMLSSEERITLWPVFGSKTDSIVHRQSGWLLSKHPNENVCPVTWIRRLIQSS